MKPQLSNNPEQALKRQLAQTQEELEKSQMALKQTTDALQNFSYAISHDLKAPLRAIEGFSKIMSEKYHDILPEEGQQYLETIQKSTKEISLQITALKTLSEIEETSIHVETVSMQNLVDEVLSEFQHDKLNINIDLHVETLPDVAGDAVLLKTVWKNLLKNAFSFTKKKDKPVVFVGIKQSSDKLIYYVKDNGVGFNMAYSHKLFNLFKRLHVDDELVGTGAGLVLTKKIIDKHNGHIWAEAEENAGATFYFTLNETRE